MNPEITPVLLDDLHLLGRSAAYEKVGQLFDGKSTEICIQTRHPKQVFRFIAACLARRGELDTGAGERCFFVEDQDTWDELCSASQPTGLILVAGPELDLDGKRGELLPKAWQRSHAVIYGAVNPRPDNHSVTTLGEPPEHEIKEVLKRHGFTGQSAGNLASQSNHNIYLLIRLLTGTAGHPVWLAGDLAFQLRGLALLGGWDDGSVKDREAVAKLVGEPYEQWAARVLPLTRQPDPPLLLEGQILRTVSLYENWQQFAPQLMDADLERFASVVRDALTEDESEEDLNRSAFLSRPEQKPSPRYSPIFRKSLAETLALVSAQRASLRCSPNLVWRLVDEVVGNLLAGQVWARWASLSSQLPRLAEASPKKFLDALEETLRKPGTEVIVPLFAQKEDWLFSRSYHPHLLWALETLAWSPEYLTRVCLILTGIARETPAGNSGNTAAGSLAGIFLPWLPQTLATIEERRAAVECVIAEDEQVGWKLLLTLLPQSHQTGSYHARPVWQDWIPADWTEGVTRADYWRQSAIYANLAVDLASANTDRMCQLIGRWKNLPKEASEKLLHFLQSARALELDQEQRYALWEKLTGEVRHHRKYASSDWALSEDSLLGLEQAAAALKPMDPLFEKRWLFNAYDHALFESDDYEGERQRVAGLREEAAAVVLAGHGPDGLIQMARGVSQAGQLGSAAARTAGPSLDASYLPKLLAEQDEKLDDFVRGYVWSRYFMESQTWLDGLGIATWENNSQVRFFSFLPFHAAVWRRADEILGARAIDYWQAIRPNAFQAGDDDLPEGARKAIEYKRPEIAVDCIHAMLFHKVAVTTDLALDALETLLRVEGAGQRVEQYDLIEVLAFLQESPVADQDRVARIEFHLLALLDRHSAGRPVVLERKLAENPEFFHEVITLCYKARTGSADTPKAGTDGESPKEEAEAEEQESPDPASDPDGSRAARAMQAYRLLDAWSIPPGTTADQDAIDEELFSVWFAKAKELCLESGHWEVAQQQLGECLMYEPSIPGEDSYRADSPVLEMLLGHLRIAKIVDQPDHEHIRRGMTTALFNSRGVHGFTGGEEEQKIAEKYRAYASRYDSATLPRIATTLRDLATGYDWDSERERKRDPYR